MKQKWIVIGIVLICVITGSIVSSADKTERSGMSVIHSNGLHCWGNLTYNEVNPGKFVTGEIWVVNKNAPSNCIALNTSLPTNGSLGYSVTERLVGILRNLNIEENTISFQMIIGFGMRIIEYDEGGIVALVVPYLFMQVRWSGEFIFEGTLHPHFIKGTVRYRGV